MDPSNQIVQGFWQGPLTTMERLSMQSVMAQGHAYHLFTYDPPAGVPVGVVVKDACDIVPESEAATFRCAQQLSDYFRIKLLLDKGGWHSDLDVVLLRPLDFPANLCFYRDHDESAISLALAKAPAGSPFLTHCAKYIELLSAEERANLSWQEIGTDFVTGAIEYFKLAQFAQSGRTFDPIHWTRVRDLVDPTVEFDLSESYAVHLFHAVWNKGPDDRRGTGFDLGQELGVELNTDGKYPEGCLYEILKRRYL
jgi:hypothetical protein